MATHSSVLAWRIPGTGEPGGLPSMGLHRVRHDCSDLAACSWRRPYRWHHPYGRKWRGTKEPLDESERGERKADLKLNIQKLRSWHLVPAAAAVAKSLQSCPTLCNPIDGSPPGSPIPGILQARTLEWVAISFSSAWKWKVKVKLLSCVQLWPFGIVYQAPLSMGFFRLTILEWIAISSSRESSLPRD